MKVKQQMKYFVCYCFSCKIFARYCLTFVSKQAIRANWDDWDEISAEWDDVIPVARAHCDDIIPVCTTSKGLSTRYFICHYFSFKYFVWY